MKMKCDWGKEKQLVIDNILERYSVDIDEVVEEYKNKNNINNELTDDEQFHIVYEYMGKKDTIVNIKNELFNFIMG